MASYLAISNSVAHQSKKIDVKGFNYKARFIHLLQQSVRNVLMTMQVRLIIFHWSIGLILIFSGCIFLPSFMHGGYGGEVVAHITPRPVESIDAAVLALGKFEGPHRIEGGDPRRKYYDRRLTTSDAQISFDLYAGPLKKSATSWAYAVYVKNWDQGRDEKVRAEIDSLLHKVRTTVQKQVRGAKVTVETYRFSPP